MPKPRACDDDLYLDYPERGHLSIHEDDPDTDDRDPSRALATFWVPNPEAYHGYSLHHVWPTPTPLPPRRRLGFPIPRVP